MLRNRYLWGLSLLIMFSSHIAQAKVELKGSMQQGGLIHGVAAPGSVVKLNGKELLITKKGQFIFGFGRNAPKNHQLVVTLPNGKTEIRNLKVKQRDYRIQRIKGIPKQIMQPSASDISRARQDTAQIKTARSKVSKLEGFLEKFQWPAIGPITGVYGSQRFYNGKPSRPHYGVDVANPTGSPVVAPAAGKVILATEDMFYSGDTILIDHGYGLNSAFLHMSKITVQRGQMVKAGDKIGEIGATGRVTGPHLDWRMNWFDQRIDPQLLVDPMPQIKKEKKK
mgnify:CR=1 FL=1